MDVNQQKIVRHYLVTRVISETFDNGNGLQTGTFIGGSEATIDLSTYYNMNMRVTYVKINGIWCSTLSDPQNVNVSSFAIHMSAAPNGLIIDQPSVPNSIYISSFEPVIISPDSGWFKELNFDAITVTTLTTGAGVLLDLNLASFYIEVGFEYRKV